MITSVAIIDGEYTIAEITIFYLRFLSNLLIASIYRL